MKNLSDEQLVNLFTENNDKAFEVLMDRHKQHLLNYILKFVKDVEICEDLYHDLLINVISAIKKKKYRAEGKFINWVLCMCHNVCIDHFRKIKRKPIIENTDEENGLNFLLYEVVEGRNAEEKMIRTEMYNDLRKQIDELPPQQKEVVMLRHFADLTFKEISQITNCSINTAIGRMRYALINLKKGVEQINYKA